MTVLVTTPTGHIGSQVLERLLEANVPLRVFARNPGKLEANVLGRVQAIAGSSEDQNALERALEGITSLLWVTPPDGEGSVLENYTRFAEAAVKAITASDVERIVNVSSGGKGLARDAGPISALHAVEDILNATGRAIRHLRCGNFMENYLYQVEGLKHGVLAYPMRGDVAVPTVATRDIAAVAAGWLTQDDWTGQEGVGVHGPQDLSFEAAAAILARVLNRPIRFQHLTADAYRAAMRGYGQSDTGIEEMLGMWAAVESGIYRAEPRTSETTTPTALEGWAAQYLRPLLNAESGSSH